MPLPQTTLALPLWIAAQDPACWLTPSETALYDSWKSEKRRTEWLAGRLAAKRLIQATFELPPLEFSIGRDGDAPCIVSADAPLVTLSLSHSEGHGAAAFSDPRTEGAVGVDIQRIRPVHPGLCARVFSPEERRQITARFGSEDDPAGMLLFWAVKEAAIKARRIAWGRPLKEIEVRLTADGAATVQMPGEPPLTAAYARLEDGWWLARAVRPPG